MNEKTWKILNKLLILVILIGTIITVAFFYLPSHLATYLAAILVVIIPQIPNNTKLAFEEKDKCIYYIFVFFAYFLGSVVNLYNITWWYDIVMHFVSGFVVGYLGFYILKKFGMYKKEKKIFNILFCTLFAIAIAGVWEIAEFSMDQLTGSNLQHNLDTGVIDTMEDIICGTVGGLLYSLMHLKRKR